MSLVIQGSGDSAQAQSVSDAQTVATDMILQQYSGATIVTSGYNLSHTAVDTGSLSLVVLTKPGQKTSKNIFFIDEADITQAGVDSVVNVVFGNLWVRPDDPLKYDLVLWATVPLADLPAGTALTDLKIFGEEIASARMLTVEEIQAATNYAEFVDGDI
ncbi:MAG: hypothetical protein CMJ75_18815 [Planctomycetaceae bacterium]|nr:hypothetical protein [Planctomycetaceae bacterium]